MDGVERARDDVIDPHALAVQPDRAAGDARDVEEVLHEAGELAGLAPRDVEGDVAVCDVELRDGDGVAHRSQRVPQLVAEHRKQLVLRMVRRVDDRARVPFGIAPGRHLDAESDAHAGHAQELAYAGHERDRQQERDVGLARAEHRLERAARGKDRGYANEDEAISPRGTKIVRAHRKQSRSARARPLRRFSRHGNAPVPSDETVSSLRLVATVLRECRARAGRVVSHASDAGGESGWTTLPGPSVVDSAAPGPGLQRNATASMGGIQIWYVAAPRGCASASAVAAPSFTAPWSTTLGKRRTVARSGRSRSPTQDCVLGRGGTRACGVR